MNADAIIILIERLAQTALDANEKWNIVSRVVAEKRSPTHAEWVDAGVSSAEAHAMVAELEPPQLPTAA